MVRAPRLLHLATLLVALGAVPAVAQDAPPAGAPPEPLAPAPPAARETVAWRGGLVFWVPSGARANLAGNATPAHLVLADPAGPRTGDYVPVLARDDGALVLHVRSDDFYTVTTRHAMVATSAKKALAVAKSKKPPAPTAVGVHLEPGAELDVLEQQGGASKVVLRNEAFMVEGWLADSVLGKAYVPAAREPGERQIAQGSVSLYDKPRGTDLIVLGAGDPVVTLVPGKRSKQKGYQLVRVDGKNAHVVGWIKAGDLTGPTDEPATPPGPSDPRAGTTSPLPAGTALSEKQGGAPVGKLRGSVPAYLGGKKDGWQEVTLFTKVGKLVAWIKP